jgi:dTDP-glucose 4,6-dehydratase
MKQQPLDLVREDCAQALADQVEKLAPLRGSQLFVTGGTGFAGTWIAEMIALLNDQHGFKTRLTLVARGTDFFRATRPHLANRNDVLLVKADVRHLAEIPRETNYLIHAAATPDTRFHSTQPIETLLTIAEGTAAVLRTIDRCSNFKMLLNLSSSRIYGTQPAELDRMPETAKGVVDCASVSAAYAEGKRYGEALCAAARSQGRIPVTTARPFAVMGPYQSIQSPWAASNFIHDAIAGTPIRILGDGQTIRSYLHGADMAFWYLRMLTAAQSGSIYNVGSPEPIRLVELAEKIASRVEPRPEIRLRTASGQIASNRSVPDTRAAEKDFGLKVRIPLDRVLERTILWNRLELG